MERVQILRRLRVILAFHSKEHKKRLSPHYCCSTDRASSHRPSNNRPRIRSRCSRSLKRFGFKSKIVFRLWFCYLWRKKILAHCMQISQASHWTILLSIIHSLALGRHSKIKKCLCVSPYKPHVSKILNINGKFVTICMHAYIWYIAPFWSHWVCQWCMKWGITVQRTENTSNATQQVGWIFKVLPKFLYSRPMNSGTAKVREHRIQVQRHVGKHLVWESVSYITSNTVNLTAEICSS